MAWIQNYEALTWWLASGSLMMFLLTLVLVPFVVIRIPSDHFLSDHHHPRFSDKHPLLGALWRAVKPVLGLVLIALGLVMLVLPGQGILTLLLGIMLLDFPGRHRLQYWMVSRPRVLRSINWLRQRSGKAPLKMRSETE